MPISRTTIPPTTTEQVGLAQINTDLDTAYDAINANEGDITTLTASVAALNPLTQGIKYGVEVRWASATTVDIDATYLGVASGATWETLSAVNQTVAITVAGAGGLDTGVEAVSTWYSIWVIYNPTAATTSCLLSEADGSVSQPTMPAGYTYKRRVGWVYNDAGGDLIEFTYDGDDSFVSWAGVDSGMPAYGPTVAYQTLLFDGTDAGGETLGLVPPNTRRLRLQCNPFWRWTPATGGQNYGFSIGMREYGTALLGGRKWTGHVTAVNAVDGHEITGTFITDIGCDSLRRIEYAYGNYWGGDGDTPVGGTVGLGIKVIGWYDNF